jgi:hypothetical protein
VRSAAAFFLDLLLLVCDCLGLACPLLYCNYFSHTKTPRVHDEEVKNVAPRTYMWVTKNVALNDFQHFYPDGTQIPQINHLKKNSK